ncbi:macrolide transporter ATP-binding /permease protein [uncultured Roseburia sp.]|uniref:ABC transporter permease n=1 Tax=Brotonthovivens ammoniilytica TaxID=2981725 RepID=A0ABT2TP42_9FIRM|nr:ABC transporter permease [Brotonthovivens ammoniilytica]MCU6763471.1 ABC transporter permease [Brotonthovivens ammoniilytica]SCJ20455.1 macrolide transporter ATP-binding /permease protein [uncultured Roseburia sp.]
MNVFQKVTFKTMKENRMRTGVTIVGVLLSAALFTALVSFCTSLFSYMEKTYIYRDGNYYLHVPNAGSDVLEECKQDDETVYAAAARYVGYAFIDSENEYKPYLYVAAADQTFFDIMPVHLVSGRMPENDGEILIPEHLNYNGNVVYKNGDTLSLKLGDRKSVLGEKLTQDDAWYGDGKENLEKTGNKTYQVVGIYERPEFEGYTAPGYTALTYSQQLVSKTDGYDLYLNIKNPGKLMDAYIERHQLADYSVEQNWNLLMFAGVIKFSNWSVIIYGFAVIFGILVLTGSISLIYSAFSISVSERTKQFGLLSSIGATKRQIKQSVFWEAGFVSLAGIPLGICLGLAGMGITFHFIGDKFHSLLESPYDVTLHVSLISILLAAGITLCTVFISVWIPARRAARVTAIEAIRQQNDITNQNKSVKTSRLFLKVFGLEGMLGRKYFIRSRKKYRTTIASLALSIILFLSVSSFTMYLRSVVSVSVVTSNYDLWYQMPEYQQETLNVLSNLSETKEMAYSSSDICDIVILPDDLAESQVKFQQAAGGFTDDVKDSGLAFTAYKFYLEDTAYEAFLKEQGLETKKYLNSDNPPAVVYNTGKQTLWENDSRITYQFEYFKQDVTSVLKVKAVPEKKGYNNVGGGMEIGEDGTWQYMYYYVREGEQEEYDQQGNLLNEVKIPAEYEKVQIGDLVSEAPLGVPTDRGTVLMIYPYSAAPRELGGSVTCYFKTDNHETLTAEMKKVLSNAGLPSGDLNIYDRVADDETNQNLLIIINVFSYGFIIMISLIAVANVFHTLSTNIALRKRDFAMLASIGITKKGIRNMLRYECILYGVRSLIFGIPIAFLGTLCMYVLVLQAVDAYFVIPGKSVLIAVISVFVIVFLTARFAVKRLQKENLIDALKAENI